MTVAVLPFLADVPDPRMERKRLHRLPAILGIALCAVLCGADSGVAMEEYGKSKHHWLATGLPLPNGIPSHDTFARVTIRLPVCLLDWSRKGVVAVQISLLMLKRVLKVPASVSCGRKSSWCIGIYTEF